MDAATNSRQRGRAWHVLLLAALLAAPQPPAQAEGPYALSVYAARNSPERLVDILRLRASTTDDAWLGALAASRTLARAEHSRLELEGQLVQHGGLQDHWELNAVVAFRWLRFPWDRYLDTRLAVGEGLSYASEEPPIEPRGDIDHDEASSRWLNYLMVEAEIKPPRPTPWAGFVRVHHRSGIFGAFGGVEGGSNFVGLGVRYYFGERTGSARPRR